LSAANSGVGWPLRNAPPPKHPNALGFIAEQRVHVIRIDHGEMPMSNRFKKAVIDDVTARNINANLQDHLLDLFESAMKSVATTLVREAKFDTTDFATAKQRGCEGFTLLVSRARAEFPRRVVRRIPARR
jgi:hypothetical protein